MIETKLVPSASGDGTSYEVTVSEPFCTCPAFQHRPGPCKHIKMVEENPDRYASSEDGIDDATVPNAVADPGLFSIGHSNHSASEFIALVQEERLSVIVDVRAKPFSRYSPHFNRFALRDALKAIGVDYYWCGMELGGLGGGMSIDNVAFQQRMAAVLRMAKVHRVAFMCSEGHPKDCHRAMKLTAWIHRVPELEDVTCSHITRDGTYLDSREFEEGQPQKWLWFCFGGERPKKR